MVRFRLWFLTCALGALVSAGWGAATAPPPNAYDFDVKASNALVGTEGILKLKMEDTSETVMAAKGTLVMKNATALALLRKGFAYDYRLPRSASLKSLSTLYRRYLLLAMLLVYEGQAKAALGDAQGALESYLDCLRFGQDIQRGAPFGAYTIGAICQVFGRTMLWQAVDGLDDAQAAAVLPRLQRGILKRATFAQCLEEEKVRTISLLDYLAAHPEALARRGNVDPGAHTEQEMDNFGTYTQPMLRDAKVIFATWINSMLAVSKAPFTQEIEYPEPKGGHERTVAYLAAMRPTLRWGHFISTETENQHALLTIAVALRAYHGAHVAYPDTLNALVPAFLPKVPGDPYNHFAPYCYKRTEEKYLLYSIGPNTTDDHGAPIAKADGDNTFASPDSAGDVVVGVNSY